MPQSTVNAKTGVYAILGDPIHHSLTPVIMNSMFNRLGMDKVCLAFRVNRENFSRLFPALRELDLAGYVVTMPVKENAARAVDRLEDEAELTGATNCIVNAKGELVGHNTDSVGFWTSVMEKSGGRRPERIFVLGAGGFAKAAIAQAALRGAKRIVAANRLEETECVEAFRHFVYRLGERTPSAEFALLDWRPEIWCEELEATDLVVNATPNGMGGRGDLQHIFPYASARRGAIFFDAIYNPLPTEFLRLAGERGHPTVDGLDLLSHQGVCTFRLWTGIEVEPSTMRRDALAFLAAVAL